VEHRWDVRPAIPPDGRAHGLHHRRAPRGSRRWRRAAVFQRGRGHLSVLDRYFALSERGATIGGEVRGGLTTFMVMAYIIFVNPAILSFAGIPALAGQGPPLPAG